MNIKSLLEPELWDEIKNNYENEDYTGAITNAVYYLRDTLREKTNLELDSKQLINGAFSQKNPKIKINKLQTTTEKNEQDGLRDSLLGIFGLIRNTLAHKKHKDTKEDALTIILYINFLLKLINKAKTSFSIDSFISTVYDKHFVQTKEYTKLLISEIPEKQLEDTILNLYKQINNNINNASISIEDMEENFHILESLNLVFSELMKIVSEDKKKEIFEHFTNDFKTLNKSYELFWKVYLILDNWNLLGKLAKLRLANIITEYTNDIEETKYQEMIFLKGWKYFDKGIQNRIKELYVENNSNYCIVNDELKLFKKDYIVIPATNKDEDKIPF